MNKPLVLLRTFFLLLCTLAGYAVSQSRPDLVHGGLYGVLIGFGLGGLLIAIDEAIKGFSLRTFSAASFGLLLGSLVAGLIDRQDLFLYGADEKTRWIIRLALFLAFGYLGMVLAVRGNKEDFALIIPFIRFRSDNKPQNLIVLDTSTIIDGRIADLIENRFIEGIVIVPKFVLNELQLIADSTDPLKRARGRRGMEVLMHIRHSPRVEVRIHELDYPAEREVDTKLLKLCRALNARLYTTDYNLGKVAEIEAIPHTNLCELAALLKPTVLPGDALTLKIAREGREKGQGVAYLGDGTMVVVNGASGLVGQQVMLQVQSLHQTGAGVIVFAEIRSQAAAA
ncbi:MAG: hypothetical protein RJA22_380 [Verrucomicrobiota bacterium]|jgi:uncharacterized protein YacL